jgi:FlaA1/EpsC-like NDP-sugar epimerase
MSYQLSVESYGLSENRKQKTENRKQKKMKKILITGAASSFGNTALNRFLHTDHFKEIRIFLRDERKQDDMHTQF